jgi:pyridoxal phosphate enzyme (YggS family)
MHAIKQNISSLKRRIANSANQCGRDPSSVRIIAVSKKHNLDSIKAAYDQGIRDFGENYLQEAMQKIELYKPENIIWHFIGPIQSNKTKLIANNFSWVHSVDRIKIAERLSSQKNPELPDLNVCLQVNIDDETSKAGFSKDEIMTVIPYLQELSGIKLRGLMAIPKFRRTMDEQRKPFYELQQLFMRISNQMQNNTYFDTLSMGMSSDLEAAIYENANLVRVGTDIFGKRP